MSDDIISTKWEIIGGGGGTSDSQVWNDVTLPGTWTNYTFDWIIPKEKVVKKFMWFPKYLKGKFRWLCFTYIQQTEVRFPPEHRYIWCDSEFKTYSEYIEWRLINE